MQENKDEASELLTFGGHLEVMRHMLFRIISVTGVIAVAVFCFKYATWQLLLAPSEWDFVTYRKIEQVVHTLGFSDFNF